MIKKLGYTASIALGFMLLGFAIMGKAWDGAASVNAPQQQIPYLLSGGAVGLGLVVIGAGLLLFEAARRVTSRLEERLNALTEVVAGRAPASEEEPERPARSAAGLNGQVVVGRSSFHRPDCRLVEGKEDLDFASLDEAQARGLNACRVCDPLGRYAGSKK